MQYKVPQNIDQEDKILGPLTFTQFVYALIGGGLLLFEFSALPLFAFYLIGIPTLLLTVAFSLIKVQDQPFTRFFVSLLIFLKQPKHRIWQDQDAEKPAPPLGKDFMADLNRDDPSTIKGAKKPALETTLDPLPEPKQKKVLAVATDQTSQAIPTISPTPSAAATIAPPAPATPITLAAPAKPARRLQINTTKGGA